MSKAEAKRESVHHWWKMAEEALQSEFEPDDVKEKIERTAAFLQAVRALLSA